MESLLDYMARESGLPYLSSLLSTKCWQAVLHKIAPESYPLNQWNEAVRYLCESQEIPFDSPCAAKDYLLRQ